MMMLMHNTLIFCFKKNSMRVFLCFIFLSFSMAMQAKEDSTYNRFSYFRVGLDLFKMSSGFLRTNYTWFEAQADVNYSKTIQLVTELGYGTAKASNAYIKYSNTNSFLRLGLDKTFFQPEFLGDFDNAFVGVRYALARVQRNAATYTITDPLWGSTTSIYPAGNFMAHWFEITGGFRLEIRRNLFAGWNMRMRSILNPRKVQEFPPSYMAGYGRGDRNTQVDFNLYLLYGFGKR